MFEPKGKQFMVNIPKDRVLTLAEITALLRLHYDGAIYEGALPEGSPSSLNELLEEVDKS